MSRIEKEFLAEEMGVGEHLVHNSLYETETNLTKEDFIVKVLSVRQPWAWLIFHGKDIENRTWKTNYRGKLFIHAPQKFDYSAIDWLYEKEMDNYLKLVADHFMYRSKFVNAREVCYDADFDSGVIIGSVDLVDCVQNHSSKWAMKDCWHWVLENPVLLDKPISCKGQLGIYNFELPRMLTASDFQERNVYHNHIIQKGE